MKTVQGGHRWIQCDFSDEKPRNRIVIIKRRKTVEMFISLLQWLAGRAVFRSGPDTPRRRSRWSETVAERLRRYIAATVLPVGTSSHHFARVPCLGPPFSRRPKNRVLTHTDDFKRVRRRKTQRNVRSK